MRALAYTSPAPRTCVLVLGMHRSGTSATTRLINLLGASLPKTLAGADASNAAGHWESRPIVKFNDRLLEVIGAKWNSAKEFTFDEVNPDVIAALRDELRNLVESEFEGAPLIVLKDPRISRLVPFYAPAFEELGYQIRVIIAHRDPMSVAKSIHLRNSQLSTGLGLLLWLLHSLDAERATRTHQRTILSFDDLMAAPMTVLSKALDRLDVAWPCPLDEAIDDIRSNLRPDLYHNRATGDAVPDVVAMVDAAMRAIATNAEAPQVIASLDRQERVVAKLLSEFADDLGPDLNIKVLHALLDYASAQMAAAENDASAAQANELTAARQQTATALATLDSIYNSRSWRVTAPLRGLSRAYAGSLRWLRGGAPVSPSPSVDVAPPRAAAR